MCEVTAVITTHARPSSVCEALLSIEAEQHQDLEVVVVDDGGSFECPSPVRVVRGSHLGVARARNRGLSAARGEFIIYLDDDDVALPNRIATLLAAIREHGADMCFGMTRRVSAGEVLDAVPTHRTSSGAVRFADLLLCAPHVNAVLVRTDALRAAGGFDTRADHFDDWSAWLRLADRGAVIRSIAEPVAEWRIHSSGLTGKVLNVGAMKRRILSLFEHLYGSLSERNAEALLEAQRIVASSEIANYEDYASLMIAARENVPCGQIVPRVPLVTPSRVQSHGSA